MTKKLRLNVIPITIFFIISSMVNVNKIPPPSFLITGSIMQTESYCKGSSPTKETLNKLRTPVGIAFGKLFIKTTHLNDENAKIIDTIQADSNGKFSIRLPRGNYCLVEAWKSKPFVLPLNSKLQTVDPECYRKLYDACDYQLNVTEDMREVKIVFHRYCFYNLPCILYKGPLPH